MRRVTMWLMLSVLVLVPGRSMAAPAPAHEPATTLPQSVTHRVMPEKVLLGEPFVWELAITHPRAERYELLTPTELGDFELLSQTRDRKDVGDSSVTTFGVKLSAFALGTLTLPSLTFEVTTPEGPRRYVADGDTVEVSSVLGDAAQTKGEQLKDLKPPAEVPIRSLRLLWALLAFMAAGALALLFVRYWKRRPVRVVPAPPPLPLGTRTRQALKALEAEGLPAKGRGREFFFRLSEIIRAYLGERYGFDAMECTSAELLFMLSRYAPKGFPRADLERFVQDSDFVKFAKAEATQEACHKALSFGHALIDATWPPPPPPTSPDAARPQLS